MVYLLSSCIYATWPPNTCNLLPFFTPFFVNEINIQVAFPLKIIFVILLHFLGKGIQNSINWYRAARLTFQINYHATGTILAIINYLNAR